MPSSIPDPDSYLVDVLWTVFHAVQTRDPIEKMETLKLLALQAAALADLVDPPPKKLGQGKELLVPLAGKVTAEGP
jgi:hypothetical protein